MNHLQGTRAKCRLFDFTLIKRRAFVLLHRIGGNGCNATLSFVSSILVLLSASPANSQLAPDASATAAVNGRSSVAVSDHTDIAKEPGNVRSGAVGTNIFNPAPGGANALNGPQTPPGAVEEALRRELAAARAELAKQAQALKEQQQTDEALTANLDTALRAIQDFRAEASLWDGKKGAMPETHPSTDASHAAANQALEEERHKAELLEQELATARQTIDALKTSANLAAAEQAKALKDRQVADAASNQAGEALELERRRADSAMRDLDSAREERDALKQSSIGLSAALDQERERANGLARSLSAARAEIDAIKDKRRTAAEMRAPKAGTSKSALASPPSRPVAARNPDLPKKRKVKGSKSPQPVLLATIALPTALLPVRPPAQ
ncbi:hypothetical protein [Mesorhizobium sp. Root172]|uniref:hypothetical protein n=1 Tax=Mesorhizobium sp. Root172 TaxID=1736481 RepID=UPI0006F8C15F|nr:hypothetical protein [Mesorhizobium sp. Root172]KRB23444.1 hypothetical protein ASE05_12610 [Mesorhizobium sp. Root172]